MMMSQNYEDKATLIAALEWHIAHGADETLLDEPVDRTAMPVIPKVTTAVAVDKPAANRDVSAPKKILNFQDSASQEDIMGAAQAIQEAQKIADSCNDLEELQQAIQAFEGLTIRKTASNMVFADGNKNSDVMVIGEAPEAKDDVVGKPFKDQSGQLLDRILACIDLDRDAETAEKAVYLSNILNWRPPGNRTPSVSEMDISRPFIVRHIDLIQPKALIICGGGAGQTLLKSKDTISKLRGKFHDYNLSNGTVIPVMVTYHPTYLLRTPAQKKAVWADMLMFQEKIISNNINLK
jgi:DNA polymerase